MKNEVEIAFQLSGLVWNRPGLSWKMAFLRIFKFELCVRFFVVGTFISSIVWFYDCALLLCWKIEGEKKMQFVISIMFSFSHANRWPYYLRCATGSSRLQFVWEKVVCVWVCCNFQACSKLHFVFLCLCVFFLSYMYWILYPVN